MAGRDTWTILHKRYKLRANGKWKRAMCLGFSGRSDSASVMWRPTFTASAAAAAALWLYRLCVFSSLKWLQQNRRALKSSYLEKKTRQSCKSGLNGLCTVPRSSDISCALQWDWTPVIREAEPLRRDQRVSTERSCKMLPKHNWWTSVTPFQYNCDRFEGDQNINFFCFDFIMWVLDNTLSYMFWTCH